ncbi:hypothetical protein [Vibrio sp. Y184]|uniref:hypothetical protein n=1 Tax=Vibrio sp. Y184 TaxID=3074705 RepID=UPI002966A8D3|nr:hypothetical protein [Vibrio sp. Y184]MDW3165416.1 hypothetical protein [Vibrio sp. Y184]
MKALVRLVFLLFLTIGAFVCHELGYLGDGVINLLLVAAWLHAGISLFSGLVLFDDKKLHEFAQTIRANNVKPWKSKATVSVTALIGCTFIYFGCWVTGIVWLLAAIVSSVLLFTLHEMARKLA